MNLLILEVQCVLIVEEVEPIHMKMLLIARNVMARV